MAIVEVDIYPIPSTLLPIYQVNMVYSCFYLVLLDVFMKVFMKIKQVIVGVMVEDV